MAVCLFIPDMSKSPILTYLGSAYALFPDGETGHFTSWKGMFCIGIDRVKWEKTSPLPSDCVYIISMIYIRRRCELILFFILQVSPVPSIRE